MGTRPKDKIARVVQATKKRRGPRSDSRERVLQAAGRLFSRKGYAGTSVDEIASKAKASPSSIYWHFKGGKDDILLAVIEEAAKNYTRSILEAVRQGKTLGEKGRIFVNAAENQMETGTETIRLIMSMALERAKEDPGVRERIRSIYRMFRQAIMDEMREAFPELDEKILRHFAVLQIGVFEGIFLQWQLDPEDVDIKMAFGLLRAGMLSAIARIERGEVPELAVRH